MADRKMDIDLQVAQIMQYLNSGYDLIPLKKWDATFSDGKPAGHTPRDHGWQTQKYNWYKDGDALRRGLNSGHNVGAILTESDLVISVKATSMKPWGSYNTLCQEFQLELSRYPSVILPNGDRHIYMKKDVNDDIRLNLRGIDGISFLTSGRQVMTAGSIHYPSGEMCTWEDGGLRGHDVPYAPENLIEAFKLENIKNRDYVVKARGYKKAKELEDQKFVYVISNPSYPGEYKVGIAKNPESRLSHYQTSDPARAYEIEFQHQTPYFRETESYIHDKFNNRHEWVTGNLEDITDEILGFCNDKSSKEKIDEDVYCPRFCGTWSRDKGSGDWYVKVQRNEDIEEEKPKQYDWIEVSKKDGSSSIQMIKKFVRSETNKFDRFHICTVYTLFELNQY